jgi:hypothetical protein
MLIISGLKIDKNHCVQFKGYYITKYGLSVKFITPSVNPNSTVFGFEDQINEIVVDIINEAYEYIHNNKTGNLTLLNNE